MQLYFVHAATFGAARLFLMKHGIHAAGLFRAMNDLAPNLQPRASVTDFELAVINAPFHLDKCSLTMVVKDLQDCFFTLINMFANAYREKDCSSNISDADVALLLRNIPTLTFVPLDHVVEFANRDIMDYLRGVAHNLQIFQ